MEALKRASWIMNAYFDICPGLEDNQSLDENITDMITDLLLYAENGDSENPCDTDEILDSVRTHIAAKSLGCR